jgi:hypothetical protein
VSDRISAGKKWRPIGVSVGEGHHDPTNPRRSLMRSLLNRRLVIAGTAVAVMLAVAVLVAMALGGGGGGGIGY